MNVNVELMPDNHKKWLSTGAVLTGIGMLLCIISSAMMQFNFKSLSTVKYVTNTYEIGDSFENISIKANTENISFVLSKDGSCKVVCCEDEKQPHDVRTENNTLLIDSSKKLNFQFMSIGEPAITVYLPKSAYTALNLDADTGDVSIPKDFSFENMDIKLDTGNTSCQASASGTINIKSDTGSILLSDVSASAVNLESDTGKIELSNMTLTETLDVKEHTGRVTLKDISCKKFTSNGSTGSLSMTNVIASEEFNLTRSTGSIEFNGCDAETIYATASTGSIKGTLLSEKVFIAEASTGSVDVPKTTTGGKCELKTSTGSIHIEIQ